MKSDYSRNVEMICSECGSKTFEYDTEKEDGNVTCISCQRIFTRQELFDVNQENMNINLEEIKQEALKDERNEIKKMLNKIF